MSISKILIGAFSLMFLISCSESNDKKEQKEEVVVDLISDQSSKVWLVDEHILQDTLLSESGRNNKRAMVFYDDGTFYMQQLKDLAFKSNTSGKYKVSGKQVYLKLSKAKKYNRLNVIYASKDSLILENQREDGFMNMRMRLVPLDYPQEKPEPVQKKKSLDIEVN